MVERIYDEDIKKNKRPLFRSLIKYLDNFLSITVLANKSENIIEIKSDKYIHPKVE